MVGGPQAVEGALRLADGGLTNASSSRRGVELTAQMSPRARTTHPAAAPRLDHRRGRARRSPRTRSASPRPTPGWTKPTAWCRGRTERLKDNQEARRDRREGRRRLSGPAHQVQGPAVRRQDQPRIPGDAARDRDRAEGPGRRRGEGARADDGGRPADRRRQEGRSRTGSAEERRSTPRRRQMAEELAVDEQTLAESLGGARRARGADSSRASLALFEQVAKARKGVAICDGHARRPVLGVPRPAAPAGVPAGAAERQHRAVRQLPADPLLRAAARADDAARHDWQVSSPVRVPPFVGIAPVPLPRIIPSCPASCDSRL